MRRCLIVISMLIWSGIATAAEVVDATGRTVQVADHVARIVPAGPPAAVLLEALAPDLMAGWPMPLSSGARALLSPDAAKLPQIPRVTGGKDVLAKIAALKPDLILDYGTVSARYADLAKATQQRTGIPTILLDGALDKVPETLRTLGAVLHRESRAATLAHFAEALLAFPAPTPDKPGTQKRVLYARGDGLIVAAPNTDVTAVFAHLGWQVVAPDGKGTFRPASIDVIRALDPDMLVFADPSMREVIARSDAWKTVRGVREGHVLFPPAQPFGWVEEPPSINGLLGFAWLEGGDPRTLAALSNAVIYGHVLTAAELDILLAGVRPAQP